MYFSQRKGDRSCAAVAAKNKLKLKSAPAMVCASRRPDKSVLRVARLCPNLLTFETGVARDFGSDFSKNSANFSDFSEISQSYNHSYQNP